MNIKERYKDAIATFEEKTYGNLVVFVSAKNIQVRKDTVTADVTISETEDVSTTYRNCVYERKTLDSYNLNC